MDKEIDIEEPEWSSFVKEAIGKVKETVDVYIKEFPNINSSELPALAHRLCLLAENVSPELEQEALNVLLSLETRFEHYGPYLLLTAERLNLDKRVDLSLFQQLEARLLDTKDAQSAGKWLDCFYLVCRHDDLLNHVKKHIHPPYLEGKLADLSWELRNSGLMGDWPVMLNDQREIAAFIDDQSESEVDVELIEELLWDCHAVLQRVKISDLKPGDEDHNIASEEKQKAYESLPSYSRPPIVVGLDNEIWDGNHRYRDAIARGETHILAYKASDGCKFESMVAIDYLEIHRREMAASKAISEDALTIQSNVQKSLSP